MRSSVRLVVLTTVALLGEAQLSYAQQAPYSYPWCSVSPGGRGGGGRSCYYTSQEQCLTTMSGIGGYCIQNPAYRGSSTTRRRRNY